MSRITCLFLCSFLTTSLTTISADAASILGDEFQITGSAAGASIAPVTGVAGSSDARSFDVNVTLDFGDIVRVGWFDDDSFDVVVEASSLPDASITLSDLDFKTMSGQPADITGATFNPNGNGYSGFFQSDDNPTGAPPVADPSITSTANSVTVEYGSDWGGQLSADWPVLRFDVETVPEPSSTAVLLTGLVSLGLIRRRSPLRS